MTTTTRYIIPIILILLLVTFFANGQTQYIVDTKTTLLVRTGPGTSNSQFGRLKNGETINVYAIKNGWAEISYNGKTGYVSEQYIKLAPVQQKIDKRWSLSAFDWKEFVDVVSKTDSLIWFYITCALGLVMVCIDWLYRADSDDFTDSATGFYVSSAIFLALCVSEMIYFATYDGDKTWFCSPDKVGWIWTIINFILFAMLLIKQVVSFSCLNYASCYHGKRNIDFRLGLYGWGIGIIAAVISVIFFDEYLYIVLWCVLGIQFLQIALLVYNNIQDGGNWLNLVYTIVFYVVGSIATLITLFHFLPLLVVVLIGYAILCFFSSSSGSARCANCRSYNNGYCYYKQISVSSGDYCSCHQYR